MNLDSENLLKDEKIIIYENNKISGNFLITEDSYIKAFDKVGFKKKTIENILDEFYDNLDYYRYKVKKHLFKNSEKKIITNEDIDTSKKCFENILNSQFRKYFIKENNN